MNRDRLRGRPSRTGWWVVFVGLIASVTACQGPFPQTTFEPVSRFGEIADGLFMTIFWFGVLVFVLVEGVLIVTLIRFRAKPDAEDPKPVYGHTALEITWTMAPAIIIAFIAVPTIRAIWEEAADPGADALRIEVVGHQWWWEYRYPEYGFISATELHIPVGRQVSLELTSADVIHSFWAPRLGGKRDVLAGRTNRIVFTADSVGEFLGQCAEFCGSSHANMRLKVMVDTQSDFDEWVALQTSGPAPADSLTELQSRGLEVFRTIRTPASNSCIACHAVTGISGGILGPNLTHMASRTTIAGGILANTEENLRAWLRDPAAVKPGQGSEGPNGGIIGMPNVGLTEEEIDALVAYLQTLR